MSSCRSILLLAFTSGVTACAAPTEESSKPTVEVDTIGGVLHVQNHGTGIWADEAGWQLDTSRVAEIGVIEGADPYVFGRVAGLVVGEDGRIYVADTQALEIRVFDRNGEFLSRFGRDGGGPGEFRNISGLGRGPDGGIAALDARSGRVSIFTTEGEFERSFRIERPYMIQVTGALVRFDGKGIFYDLTKLSRTIGTDTVGIIRYGADGGVKDTTVVAAYEPPQVYVRRNGVPVMSFSLPFAAEPSSTVGPDGLLYVTRGETYSIAQLTPEGDTVRVIRRSVEPLVVGASERDLALEGIKARYREAAGAEPTDLPRVPARKPAISSLRVDEEGNLWVLRPFTNEGGMVWDVFDSAGMYFGALELPPMNVMHIGKHAVAGVTHDEMGVARVRVLRLSRGGAD